ncbi:hypothetical protein MLD52_23405, partial [Puniceicoccaceae bacterium K14]|nr:hypothetical protein [Puniceicoccaceae bacterium K14]
YASSFTASLSGQPAEGNLLLLFFSAKQSAPNYTLPSGYTVLAESYPSNAYILVAAKIAESSESASTTVTTTSSSGGALMVCEYTSDNGFDIGSMTIASAFNSSSINTTNHNVGSLSLNDPADL